MGGRVNHDAAIAGATPEMSVCVCTFHRVQRLAKLLLSLATQSVAADRIEIVVVDNDPAGSAESVVHQFSQEHPDSTVRYVVEEKPGVSHARNRAVAESRAGMLAFIDDDEVASPDWLERLLLAAVQFKADVVLGPTRVTLDAGLPGWLRQLNERSHLDDLLTGQAVPRGMGGAGNALIRRSAFGVRAARPFDPRLTHTGGEDGELFNWMRDQGALVVWSAEAVCWESLGPERLTIRFYVRRSLTFATVHWRGVYQRSGALRVAALALVGLSMAIGFGLFSLVAWPVVRRRAVPLVLISVRGAGRLLALTSYDLPIYGAPPVSRATEREALTGTGRQP